MNKQSVAERLHRFEGSVPHMYRCTGGEVTIGVGHAIPSAADARQLPWAAVTVDLISDDWARVKAAPQGLPAGQYVSLSSCRMSAEAIDALLSDDIDDFAARIEKALPNWPRYPEPVQEALFDMAYNLGVAGLKDFPKMLAACDQGDWVTAASESHRIGIPDDRNQETATLLLQAGKG